MAAPLPQLPTDGGLAWSACVTDATARPVWSHDPTRVLRTASVGKVLLLLEVDRLVGRGELAPDELLPKPADVVRDSGLWHTMSSAALPVDDLAVLVGAVSDNLATNALLARVGVDAVDRLRERLGLVGTRLLDEVRTDRGPGDPPTLSTGRADELCRLMTHVVTGAAAGVSPGEHEQTSVGCRVAGWLAGGTDLSMVAGAFDLDPLAHRADDRPPVLLVHKTGTDAGIRADTGYVRRPGDGQEHTGHAYAVVAGWDPALGDRTAEVLAAMREVGVWLAGLVDRFDS